MKTYFTLLALILSLFLVKTGTGQTGRIVTEIGSIPDQITVQLASKPGVSIKPDINGQYEIAAPPGDYLLILPQEKDQLIYSPRIILAEQIGADTLYIIPPSFEEYTVIVDNLTTLSFRFVADRAIISEALETAKKDYQLEIIAHKELPKLRIAAISEDRPAVVKDVSFMPNQRRGYLKISAADVGLEEYQAQAAVPAPEPKPIVTEPSVKEVSPPAVEEQRSSPPVVEIDRTPAPAKQELEKESGPQEESEKPDKAGISNPIVISESLTESLQKFSETSEVSVTFVNSRLVLTRSDKLIASVGGGYAYLAASGGTSYGGGSIGIHNLALFQQQFDVHAHIAKASNLGGYYYEGTLVWRPTSFVAMDVSLLNGTDDAWDSALFLSRTSLGLNGNYLLPSNFGRLGIGARFQLDYSNFERFVPNTVESRVRYLPSIYLLSMIKFSKSNLGLMLGAVNEGIFFSTTMTISGRTGISYSWKSRSQDDFLLSPFEGSQQHRLSASYYFPLRR